MKRIVVKPAPGAKLTARAQAVGSVPRHRPVVEPVPIGLPSLNQSLAAGPRFLSHNVESTPRAETFVQRGNVRLRTTERPNGANTSRREKPDDKRPQTDKKAESFHFMMRLPFLYANTLAQSESHYLKQRNRSSWWTKGPFPKIPRDTVKDVMKESSLEPFEVLVKMLPLTVVFFSATFNLCILQNVKDTIMITQVGAETLPFLAGFGVLPASVIFFTFYNKLVNALPVKTVFYAAVAPLLACYGLFALFLYPAAPHLHLHGFIEAFSPHVPVGFTGLLQCIENWTYSAFFCVAELWGAVVISVLFWSLANDVCTVHEAKTIYPLMGISANVALVIAGTFIKNLPPLPPLLSLRVLIGSVMVMSLVMFAGKYYLDKNILPKVEEEHELKNLAKKKKTKGSFKEGFAVLMESPKIMNLALLVIGCSVSHRLFDVAWKGQLKLVYPTALAYQSVLADVSVWTGMSTIAAMIGGKFAFQYLGWGFAAATTPIVMLFTGCVFFAISIMYNSGAASLGLATIGAMAGNITQVVCKAAKYSLFDPAKEMVYIEMSKEEKSKGKAAVDLVSNQVGKTGASWMSQALLLAFGSIPASMPCIASLYTGVIVMWTASVFKLKKQLKKTEEERLKDSLKSAVAGEGLEHLPSTNGNGAHLPQNGMKHRKISNGEHANKAEGINLGSPINAITHPSG